MDSAAGVPRAFPVPGVDDLNPVKYLGDVIVGSVTDAWTTAMLALWSAGLWMTKWVFGVVGALSTPDVTATGPLRTILGTTLWISASLALILMFVQLLVALVRRDGQSIGRLCLGVFQYGMVWASFLAIAAGMVAATAGLARGITHATLGVDTLSAYNLTASWPREVVDSTAATVLGITSVLLLIPAAFFALLIGLTAEGALIILVAVAPITASGLISESTRPIFWKSFRWFIACVLISPTDALVLGIGTKVSAGVVAGAGDKTAAAIGTGVVGTVMVATAAVCPLALFRLLAWVDPGTPSGAALRQTWSEAGGMAGLTGGGRGGGQGGGSGNGSAATVAQDGRSGGEATADGATGSRMATAMAAFGTGVQMATTVAMRAGDLSADILGGAGVGSPGYSMTPADEQALRAGRSGGGQDGEDGAGTAGGGGAPAGGPGAPGQPGAAGPPGAGGPPGTAGTTGPNFPAAGGGSGGAGTGGASGAPGASGAGGAAGAAAAI